MRIEKPSDASVNLIVWTGWRKPIKDKLISRVATDSLHRFSRVQSMAFSSLLPLRGRKTISEYERAEVQPMLHSGWTMSRSRA